MSDSTEVPTPFARPGAAPDPATRTGDGVRLLVIDDDEIDRLALRRHVAREGLPYVVIEAATVAEARDRLAAGGYDVVLLDNRLPDGEGADLLGAMGEAPVIFVTGAHDVALAVRALRAGAADYLLKDEARDYLKLLPIAVDRVVQERRTRALLRESDQLCHQVFEDAPLGKVVTGPGGTVCRANRAACALLGYDEAELVAMGLAGVLAPVERAGFLAGLDEAAAGRMASSCRERDVRHRGGRPLRVEFHVSAIRVAAGAPRRCVIQLKDITAAWQLEQALRASELRMQSLLNAMPAAVFATEAGGRVSYCNAQAASLWRGVLEPGSGADAVRHALAPRVDSEGDRAAVEQLLQAAAGGAAVRDLELNVGVAGGERRDMLAYANPMPDAEGAQPGAIHILVDVTQLKALQRRHRILEQQWHHAHRLEAIGTLAGGIAHEFNNVLTSILGHLQLAEFDLGPGHAARAGIAQALASSRRARDLVRRMLAFSVEAPGARKPCDLAELVQESIELWRPAVPPGVELRLHLPKGCPRVACNPAEVKEAVHQLALNAAQAMAGRRGVLEIAVTHGAPSGAERERHARLREDHVVGVSVRDTGPGIPAACLDRVFEPFFTTREPGAGAGLGLAVVYGIMKRHRGAVTLESAAGAGTIARLHFPASPEVHP